MNRRLMKEAETKFNAVALEYAMAQYLAGPSKISAKTEGVEKVEDMGNMIHQWMERVKIKTGGDQDKALTVIFKAFQKAFPEVYLSVE